MEQELINYGLSENEARVYLICIKTGQSTANRIAQLANLARSTTYDILDRLKAAGLITTCIVGSKTNFIANDPNVLMTMLSEKKNSIESILPSLHDSYKKIEDKPSAEVFSGKIAVVRILDEILDNTKKLKVIGSQGNALQKIGYHPEKFRLKRISKKINIRQILEISKESEKIRPDKYTQIRYLKSLNTSKEAIFISDECTYHIILQYEISAIKIRSKDHAHSMGIMFDELWEKGRAYKPKSL